MTAWSSTMASWRPMLSAVASRRRSDPSGVSEIWITDAAGPFTNLVARSMSAFVRIAGPSR